ncbi:MAG: multicopper oxidase family protein [Methanobacteriota archaeon]|nr:MAG: multicopper oxidase family protein [Euryarchaeota archaeon]
MNRRLTRRDFMKYGAAALGAVTLANSGLYFLLQQATRSARADDEEFRTPIRFTPFTRALPIPPVKQPGALFTHRCALPSVSGLNPPKFYTVQMKKATAEIIPGHPETVIWGYDGLYPGPTFRVNHNEPAIVRFSNGLSVNTIVHNHGGHTSSESDGSDSVFPSQVIPPTQSRDFCYGNIAPVNPATHQQEISDFASTQWYHDHMMDLTGQNVYMGLAGFYLLKDELEKGLIDGGTLPSDAFDVPLVFQDRVFDQNAQLVFKPGANEFDGWLGDVFVVNGKAQPYFNVQRRKYRFRLLNGSNARWYEFQLSSGQFLQIGNDSWLLPFAIPRTSIRLGLAERADVIIDFRDAPGEVFLNNILEQKEGTGPEGTTRPGTPLLKFIVSGSPVSGDARVVSGTALRPHTPIRPEEIVRTRRFVFAKDHKWVINEQEFDPNRSDATPKSNTAERWILKNDGGGWSHPVHLHLEAHQIQKFNGSAPAVYNSFKKDTTPLGPDDEAEVFIKFRTFTGRYVFHCHNLEHEDHAMMAAFNVIP